jgi:hypothetical protein
MAFFSYTRIETLAISVGDPWHFWYGSGSRSPDPYLWLMDPYPTLDPAPDTTIYFSNFKDEKF